MVGENEKILSEKFVQGLNILSLEENFGAECRSSDACISFRQPGYVTHGSFMRHPRGTTIQHLLKFLVKISLSFLPELFSAAGAKVQDSRYKKFLRN